MSGAMMQKLKWILLALLCVISIRASFAIDQAMPSKSPVDPHAGLQMPSGHGSMMQPKPGPAAPEQDRSAFQAAVNLDGLRTLALQHRDQVKIFDSWARQTISTIRNHQRIDKNDSLYTALDIAFRTDAWADKNIIYIQAIPIRQELARLATNVSESERILQTGLVSPNFIERPDVLELLNTLRLDTKLLGPVNKIQAAYETYRNAWATMAFIPPGPTERDQPWRLPAELRANFPEGVAELTRAGIKDLAPVPGYSTEQARDIWLAYRQLHKGWAAGEATLVNTAITKLAQILPTIDPQGYPSPEKRTTELWYNRTAYGTTGNVFLYFAAMTLFLLVAVGVNAKLRRWAYPVFTAAVILHIASMAVRMWLAGRWPTQNQFESVLGAALLGCVVGWILETWKKDGLFGMAFSFVGFLAMTACMAAPYMFGNDLGGAISKTAGILQTYWLYIHVNIVIASYALIAATFILGAVYLLARLWHWINPLEPPAEDAGGFPVGPVQTAGAPTVPQFVLSREAIVQIEQQRSQTLAVLDQANMVILQMAFWFLGIGIVCGAVWADHSWGRPWGWDPKETFALVTWIVYLIIVHVRIVLPRLKADATAGMSIAGFLIMMFNWIGVNYFLAGLHSYA